MIRNVTISNANTTDELRKALNKSLQTLVDQLNNQKPATPQSMNGQRVVDVGWPVAPNDAVTLTYLNSTLKRQPKRTTIKNVDAEVVRIEKGTHSERLAADVNEFAIGDVWFETDRTYFYQVRPSAGDTVKWVFMAGRYVSTFSNKPSDLGTDDSGAEFAATDVDHCWRWSGSAWGWAPQERIPGELANFTLNPGNGWAICTGGTATSYTAVATSTTVTVPDLRDLFVVGGTSYAGTSVSETTGTFTSTSSAAGGHGHSVTVTVGGESVATGTGASATVGADGAASGTATNVGDHQHVVSGTVSGALPPRMVVLWYLRT